MKEIIKQSFDIPIDIIYHISIQSYKALIVLRLCCKSYYALTRQIWIDTCKQILLKFWHNLTEKIEYFARSQDTSPRGVNRFGGWYAIGLTNNLFRALDQKSLPNITTWAMYVNSLDGYENIHLIASISTTSYGPLDLAEFIHEIYRTIIRFDKRYCKLLSLISAE